MNQVTVPGAGLSTEVACPYPRILEYQPHVKKIASFYHKFGLICLAIAAGVALVNFLGPNRFSVGIFLAACVLAGFAAEFLLLYYFRLRPLQMTRVELTSDQLILTNHKGPQIIRFDQITTLNPSVRQFGGWFVVTTQDKRKFRFEITLRGAYRVLDAILEKNPSLLRLEKAADARKHLALGEIEFSFLGIFKSRFPIPIVLLVFVAAFFVQKHFYDLNFNHPGLIEIVGGYWLLTFGICLIAVGVSSGLVINRVLRRELHSRYQHNMHEVSRNIPLERLWASRFAWGKHLVAVGICAAVILSGFNMQSEVELGDSVVSMDYRYHRLDGTYALKQDDLVSFAEKRKSYFGKIVALPGRSADILRPSSDGRILAGQAEASERIEIPPHSVGILARIPDQKDKDQFIEKMVLVPEGQLLARVTVTKKPAPKP